MGWRTRWIGRCWSGGRRGRNEVLTTIALIVDWYGPYPKIEDAKKAAEEFGEVLYLATGKRAYQRTASMQYVGISTDPKWRLNNNHHKLPEITKNFGIWLGEIGSQSLAGRRPQGHPTMHSKPVDLAEWVLAYFLQLPLNVRKRKNPPSDPVILISRWFKSDFETDGRGAVTRSGQTILNLIRTTNSRGCNGSVHQVRADACQRIKSRRWLSKPHRLLRNPEKHRERSSDRQHRRVIYAADHAADFLPVGGGHAIEHCE